MLLIMPRLDPPDLTTLRVSVSLISHVIFTGNSPADITAVLERTAAAPTSVHAEDTITVLHETGKSSRQTLGLPS
jgi:hypothetical protein